MLRTRREFLKSSCALAAAGLGVGSLRADDKKGFEISLAEWSLHKALFAKKLSNLEFAKFAKEQCGINAIEYVNQFFKDKATDDSYLKELNQRAGDLGVKQVLIMIDGEGNLGDPDEERRIKAVENHHKWVEAAKMLGCHSIRVNAASRGSKEEQRKLCIDGLSRLSEFA
ncbi:MAG: TIM barrel protein, partial [Planctomycetota bacterium]